MSINDDISDDLGAAQALADDMRKAEADCVRRGWLRALGNGRFEITDEGERHLFDLLDTTPTYH
jgi:predicted transcriptional regulator